MAVALKAKSAKAGSSYSTKDIKILGTMESLRAKLSMYLGSDGLFQVVKEVVDNSVDEFIQGRGGKITVSIAKDGEITVIDTALGIPVGDTIDPETKKKLNTLTAVFTKLHAGGKFNTKAYDKGSKGTHGIGVTATNAVSEYLRVWTCYKKKWWHQAFKLGEKQFDVKSVPAPKILGKTRTLGTVVQFKPKYSLFKKTSKLDMKKVREYLDILSYIHSGLVIVLKADGKTKIYKQPDGLKSLITRELGKLEAEPLGKPLSFIEKGVACSFQWSSHSEEHFLAYVNGSFTREGGTHVRGFLDAVNEAIKPFKGKRDFSPDDFRAGLIVVLNVSVVEPEFSSQTKERLETESAQKLVADVAKPHLVKYFAANKAFVTTLLKRAEDMKKQREQFKANKKAIAALKSNKDMFKLSTKYSPATSRDTSKIELYIVEGDSAGGTAKEARDRQFQAILRLRGKPINAYGPSSKKLYDNAEVRSILKAMGFTGEAEQPDKLKVGKVILLADSDVDGRHISVLILGMLMRIIPKIFDRGMVHLVEGPLFIARTSKGKLLKGDTLKEVQSQLIELKEKAKDGIKRLKGWGEANPPELEELAMNPRTRKLIKVKPVSGKELREFVALVGEDSNAKKTLLGLNSTKDAGK